MRIIWILKLGRLHLTFGKVYTFVDGENILFLIVGDRFFYDYFYTEEIRRMKLRKIDIFSDSRL